MVCGLIALGVIDMGANNNNVDAINPRLMMGFLAGASLVGFVIYAGMGYGLRHLQQWARWTTIVVIGLSLVWQVAQVGLAMALGGANPGLVIGMLIGGAIGAIIPAYIIWLMVSSKGAMVFSKEYREVIRLTPHVKYKMSFILKFLIGLVIFIVLLGVVGGIIGGLSSR